MPILEKTGRFAAIALAVLFISLSLFGIFGVWFVDRWATDVVLKLATYSYNVVVVYENFKGASAGENPILREIVRSASAKQSRCRSSQIPASPSSPQ
jgi:hypothetical protein